MRRPRLDLPPLEAEIERLSLGEYVRELDDQGLCVVPPERTGFGPDFVERGRRALPAVASERTGDRFGLAEGCIDELDGPSAAIGQFFVTHLVYVGQEQGPDVGRVFEEIVVNPVKKAILRHVLGDAHRMSMSNGWIKWHPREPRGPVHDAAPRGHGPGRAKALARGQALRRQHELAADRLHARGRSVLLRAGESSPGHHAALPGSRGAGGPGGSAGRLPRQVPRRRLARVANGRRDCGSASTACIAGRTTSRSRTTGATSRPRRSRAVRTRATCGSRRARTIRGWRSGMA